MSKKSRDEALDKALEGTTSDEGDDSRGIVVDSGSSALAERGSGTGFLVANDEKGMMTELYQEFGVSPDEVEIIAAGTTLPFWPAMASAVCIGRLENRREVQTKYRTEKNPTGIVGLYTVTLEKHAIGARKKLDSEGRPMIGPNGQPLIEALEMEPGSQISVLERTVLGELRYRVGQRVGILCTGKKEGSKYSYWNYMVIGQRRTPAEIQASSQMRMAELQTAQAPKRLSTS